MERWQSVDRAFLPAERPSPQTAGEGAKPVAQSLMSAEGRDIKERKTKSQGEKERDREKQIARQRGRERERGKEQGRQIESGREMQREGKLRKQDRPTVVTEVRNSWGGEGQETSYAVKLH